MNVKRLLARKKELEEKQKALDAEIKAAEASAKKARLAQIAKLVDQLGLAELPIDQLTAGLKELAKLNQ